MILLNGKKLELGHFSDGAFRIREDVPRAYGTERRAELVWRYHSDDELLALIYITRHLKEHGVTDVRLTMPYIPNARQDRVKSNVDVFTLKYFSELINALGFTTVTVLDPHSTVSEALIDRVIVETPAKYIQSVLDEIGRDVLLFFPDEGAMKRYSTMADLPYVFGMKQRDWTGGEIQSLQVVGQTERVKGSRILIIDDICSSGGTICRAARELKKLGAEQIYLFVSHCENTVLHSELLAEDLLEAIYTTDSIYSAEHEKIIVLHGQ